MTTHKHDEPTFGHKPGGSGEPKFGEPGKKAGAEKDALPVPVSRTTISHTTVGVLDADPLFSAEAATPQALGIKVAPLLPYLKAALITLNVPGEEEPTASEVFAEAQSRAAADEAQAEQHAKAEAHAKTAATAK